jgi:hypothetical protein
VLTLAILVQNGESGITALGTRAKAFGVLRYTGHLDPYQVAVG